MPPAATLKPRPGGTVDADNVALFAGLAADWWDPDGSSRLLHRINPVRLAYVREHAVAHFSLDPGARRALNGLRALDIGCGGGLVAEPLARMGAEVVGCDASAEAIAVARAHARDQRLAIDYRQGEASELAAQMASAFDLITCFEVIEHVTDVGLFLGQLHGLLRPGGLLVFSTPNRTGLSHAVMITGAERILRMLPVGAHDWQQFLTPDELSGQLRAAGFTPRGMRGLSWRPGRGFHLSDDMSVNYLGHAIAGEPSR
jgi:2-polyprenyl-6-hydroxyphenyl methylase/3-demethylubiquinone-9 3-methyltransferase